MTILLKSVAEISKAKQPPYLVKGLLTAGTTSVLFGEPKTRKSFIALDLAAHIALGWEWCGHKVLQGAVVYIVAEGWHNINNRVEAFFRQHDQTRGGVPLYIMQPVKFGGDGKDDVEATVAAIKERGIEPVMIVLDTLNRTMIGDENSTKEMSQFIRRVDAIRDKTKAHILIIHHTGKNPERGARGSSALKGAVDTEALVERQEDLSVLSVQVQRDLPEDFRQSFEAKQIEVGEDEDGDKITSLVVLPTDREPELGDDRDTLAFNALSDVAKRDGIRGGDVGAPCEGRFYVTQVEAWRAEFMSRYRGKAKEKAFARARASLLNKGQIGVEPPWAWPVWSGKDELPF